MSRGGAPDFFYREAQRLGYVARSAFKLIQIQQQFRVIGPAAAVLDLGAAPGAWLQVSSALSLFGLLFQVADALYTCSFQVACQNLGPLERGGSVLGIDVKVRSLAHSHTSTCAAHYSRRYSLLYHSWQKVQLPSSHCDSRVAAISADVMALRHHQARALSPQARGFSVILSDMCPSLSGITTKDAALSCQLAARAISLAVGPATAAAAAQIQHFLSATDQDADDAGVLRRGGNLVIKLLESEDVPGFVLRTPTIND